MLASRFGLFYYTFNPIQISLGLEIWVGEFVRVHIGPLSLTWAYKTTKQDEGK